MNPAALRDPARVHALAGEVAAVAAELDRRVTLMEVCGTHTHAIAEAGIRRLLPRSVRLVAGPGCPVCVTPISYVDRAVALARRPDVTVVSFGDLLRVPSSDSSLERESAAGADVRVVYSAREALDVAAALPGREVVFLGVGFETTMPTIAAMLEEAEARGLPNLRVLAGAKLIEPPLRALAADPDVALDGLLLPGHVSVIVGSDFYRFVEDELGVPGVVAGFEPVDLMRAILALLVQLRDGRPRVENLYPRAVRPGGNARARALVDAWFEPVDTEWRGLGTIPGSGLGFRKGREHRDAALLACTPVASHEPGGCLCGDVLKGVVDPPGCPLFDHGCTPDRPIGACMVSSEGTCAAWYRHERAALEAAR